MIRKIICLFLSLLLCAAMAVTAFSAENTEFLYDEADLLTDAEEAALTKELASVSREYDAQIVIATITSSQGADMDDFVEYLYNHMDFGYGPDRDGILLLLCMDIREYRILSNGYAGVALDSNNIGKINDKIVPDLSEGDYAGGFSEFVSECAYYLDGYLNGFPFNAGKSLAISLAVGIAIGLIVVLILRGQLKTVYKQNRAHDYIRSGSMQVTTRQDFYLYRNVTRTKKQTSNSSGSSRGTARSKGGGSF